MCPWKVTALHLQQPTSLATDITVQLTSLFELYLLQVEESLAMVLNCLHVCSIWFLKSFCCLQVIMDSCVSHWPILKSWFFGPKFTHCEKVEMQSIMWFDGQPRWEDLQDMSELAELAKTLEEPAVKNLPIVEVDPLTPLLKAVTIKEESPNSLKVEVGSPKRSRSPRTQKRGRIDWSHPEVRKVVDDDADVRCKLSFDKCVGGQWGVQMGWHCSFSFGMSGLHSSSVIWN